MKMSDITWDYLGWEKLNLPNNTANQKDWTQTLLTSFNQCSAVIHRVTHRGGANYISINEHLLPMLKEIEFFIEDNNSIGHRFSIIIDNTQPKDTIVIFRKRDIPENIAEFISYEKVEGSHIEAMSYESALIGTERYNDFISNPNKTLITDEMLKREIKILNYND